jgi:hypothetical protein
VPASYSWAIKPLLQAWICLGGTCLRIFIANCRSACSKCLCDLCFMPVLYVNHQGLIGLPSVLLAYYKQGSIRRKQTEPQRSLRWHQSTPLVFNLSQLTLKFSVNTRCASLNSGVENERRGSSVWRMSWSCKDLYRKCLQLLLHV